MVPIIYLAMVKHQGQTWIESIKNVWFYLQTKELPYEMEERDFSSYRIFSMDSKQEKVQRKKRPTRRRKR